MLVHEVGREVVREPGGDLRLRLKKLEERGLLLLGEVLRSTLARS
jgi:hypothetical protein